MLTADPHRLSRRCKSLRTLRWLGIGAWSIRGPDDAEFVEGDADGESCYPCSTDEDKLLSGISPHCFGSDLNYEEIEVGRWEDVDESSLRSPRYDVSSDSFTGGNAPARPTRKSESRREAMKGSIGDRAHGTSSPAAQGQLRRGQTSRAAGHARKSSAAGSSSTTSAQAAGARATADKTTRRRMRYNSAGALVIGWASASGSAAARAEGRTKKTTTTTVNENKQSAGRASGSGGAKR